MRRLPKIFKKIDWKYSIGELILIVSGILIALALNQWNEKRKLYDKETEILRELKVSLKNDMEDILINLDVHNQSYNSVMVLLDHLKSKRSYNETLDPHFGKVLGTTIFLTDDAAYNNLQDKGRHLVTNDSIRANLSILYAHDYKFIVALEEIDNQNLLFHLKPFYTQHFKNFRLFRSAKPRNYNYLIKDPEYISQLEWIRDNRIYTVSRYKTIKNKVENILDLLDEELKNR
jgi:hypothetical protein